MNFPIYGDDVTLTPQGKILDNIFKFTGDGLTKLGLPSGFFFQMPDKFALPTEQSINQHGQLINTLPITRGMCLLTGIYTKLGLEPAGSGNISLISSFPESLFSQPGKSFTCLYISANFAMDAFSNDFT